MTWTVQYLPDENTVQIEATGKIVRADAAAQVKEVVQVLKEEESIRILCDYFHVQSEITVAELYFLPKLYSELGLPRSIKGGLVLPKTGHRREDYVFWETRCRNEGFNIKLFYDIQTAREWLVQ